MWRCILSLLLAAAFLTACSRGWVPDEKQDVYKKNYTLTPDGYYRVRRDDTLYAIAFNFGLNWKDLAAWNGVRSPYTIYPGQELRLSPAPGRTTKTPASASAKTGAATPPKQSSSSPTVSTGQSPSARQSASPQQPRSSPPASGPSKWLWPTEGRLVSRFKANDPSRNGIEIGGKEGQAIKASAAGEVVYSGNGLIGYGELIIIKHSEKMLSAYAHNRKRLVSEGQRVKAGERIAEMGKNDRNQPILHFEIRLDGTPRDPLAYLPSR